VPSISWLNRGDVNGNGDTDNFDANFGSNAAVARMDVQASIDRWNDVITNFNYYGTSHAADFHLTVDAANTDGLAETWDDSVSVDAQGKPYTARVTIQNGLGRGWYFDPVPGDNSEFDSDVPFSGSGGSGGIDLVSTVLHEIGHAVGFDSIVYNGNTESLKADEQPIPGTNPTLYGVPLS